MKRQILFSCILFCEKKNIAPKFILLRMQRIVFQIFAYALSEFGVCYSP